MRILLADNNDSFTRNLEHLIHAATNAKPHIVRYEHLAPVNPTDWDVIVISPGPGHPLEYSEYARFIDSGVPVLGVCMGMQVINSHFGGITSRLPDCVHGKSDTIVMEGEQRVIARYHSLYLSEVGQGLVVTATNRSNVPMAVRHESRPIMGYQFHPESFLTHNGTWYITHAFNFFGFTA